MVSKYYIFDSGRYFFNLLDYSCKRGQLEYKFLNGNAWGDDESVPAPIQVGTNGNSNRWAVISGTNSAVMFGGAAPAGQKAIQFKVDMALQTVSSDSVHVAGNFQGWDPAKSQMVNFDGVHRYIAYVARRILRTSSSSTVTDGV